MGGICCHLAGVRVTVGVGLGGHCGAFGIIWGGNWGPWRSFGVIGGCWGFMEGIGGGGWGL